jgi:hypothetical protein
MFPEFSTCVGYLNVPAYTAKSEDPKADALGKVPIALCCRYLCIVRC